ncbi:hypothetical protein SNEBB_001998 [Seison nebaliae]|nr:hypothetical protein SNEBB_001998 [Seison nebaliae]
MFTEDTVLTSDKYNEFFYRDGIKTDYFDDFWLDLFKKELPASDYFDNLGTINAYLKKYRVFEQVHYTTTLKGYHKSISMEPYLFFFLLYSIAMVLFILVLTIMKLLDKVFADFDQQWKPNDNVLY